MVAGAEAALEYEIWCCKVGGAGDPLADTTLLRLLLGTPGGAAPVLDEEKTDAADKPDGYGEEGTDPDGILDIGVDGTLVDLK